MKNQKNQKSIRIGSLFLGAMLGMALFLFPSCEKDEDFAKPVIVLSSSQTSNAVGSEIIVNVSVNAPAGLQSISVAKNGVSLLTETVGNNPKNYDWEFVYLVDDQIGSTVNFTFQAVDKENQSSDWVLMELYVTAKPVKEIPAGSLLGEHFWSNDTIYRLNGFVRVGSDEQQADGSFVQQEGILHIQPGTLIVGDKESKGTLIVQRGSKIFADGTAEQPIVMTSEAPVGQRLPGDWGGLVVCGRVINNQGADIQLEGGYGGWHGGNAALDDVSESSGVIRYVRIEYAGIPINPNEEVNSLTMGSVGKGTVIEYVQCSYGLDDAFEWFGGSVDCKYLVAYRCLDDDLDVDYGYSGNVQFALVIRDPNLADQSGSNGFEVDNNGQGTDQQPFTSGNFANVTVIGPKKTRETPINTNYQHGAQLRRNSMLRIYNSFITGFPYGIYIDDQRGSTSSHALNDDLRLRNVILAGVEGWGGNGYGTAYDAGVEGIIDGLPFEYENHPNAPRGLSLKQDDINPDFDVVAWFNTPAYNNMRLPKWQDAGIDPTIFDLIENPGVLPLGSSMLLNAARWDNVPDAGNFEQVDFIGAFGTHDWTEGWTEWLPGVQVYF